MAIRRIGSAQTGAGGAQPAVRAGGGSRRLALCFGSGGDGRRAGGRRRHRPPGAPGHQEHHRHPRRGRLRARGRGPGRRLARRSEGFRRLQCRVCRVFRRQSAGQGLRSVVDDDRLQGRDRLRGLQESRPSRNGWNKERYGQQGEKGNGGRSHRARRQAGGAHSRHRSGDPYPRPPLSPRAADADQRDRARHRGAAFDGLRNRRPPDEGEDPRGLRRGGARFPGSPALLFRPRLHREVRPHPRGRAAPQGPHRKDWRNLPALYDRGQQVRRRHDEARRPPFQNQQQRRRDHPPAVDGIRTPAAVPSHGRSDPRP